MHRLDIGDYRLSDAVHDTDDERVAHAEGAVAVRHAGIGPARGEALQAVQLVGDEPAPLAIPADDGRHAGRVAFETLREA